MSKKPQTIQQFFKQFPDDETCLNHLVEIRFGQGFECPSCERPSKWFRIKAERAYSCQWCSHHLHPIAAMVPCDLSFHHDAQRRGGEGIGAPAWRHLPDRVAHVHLIREHMADVDGDAPIGGADEVVEIDETFVGGVYKRGKHGGNPAESKTIVFGVMERDGDIATKVVGNRKQGTIYPLIKDAVEAETEMMVRGSGRAALISSCLARNCGQYFPAARLPAVPSCLYQDSRIRTREPIGGVRLS